MAKQKGIFKVEGTIDEVTFYRSKDGYMVRGKGGVSAERIASDPAFIRTRENQAEFGRAGSAGKMFRSAFRTLLLNASDSRVVSRLHKEMMRVVKADLTSTRGLRNVLDGELELLEGFECNIDGKFAQTFFAPYTASVDRTTGVLTISIPPFVPLNSLFTPLEATHFQIIGGGGEIDFEAGTHTVTVSTPAAVPLSSDATNAIDFTFNVPANSTHPLFLLAGICFYQQVNGKEYPLKNGSYNALAVVKVSGV